jgi:hypothetical protein
MPSYVFFNKNTGQIVHTHKEVTLTGQSLSIPKEELRTGALLKQLEDRIESEDVEVLEVIRNEHLLHRNVSPDDETELYVDVQARALSEREKGQH